MEQLATLSKFRIERISIEPGMRHVYFATLTGLNSPSAPDGCPFPSVEYLLRD
jgi:hypothetical protein